MTRPLQRRPDGTLEEHEAQPAARPAPAAAERMLELQQGAGNAALARVLAREPAAGAPIQLPGARVPSPWEINPLSLLPQLKPEVKRAVDAYLERQAGVIRAMGTPMPVLLDEIRRNVPEAADADTSAIKDRVHAIVPGVPATRAGASMGQKKQEQEASIANRFPKPPTSVTVGNAQTYVKVEIVSAELKTPVIKAKVDKEGGEAEYEKGGAKVGVSGKWDGSEFGLKTEVHGVKFGGKIHKKNDGLGLVGRPRGPALGRRGRRGARRRRRGRRRPHRDRRVARPPAGRRRGQRRLRHRPDGADQARDRRDRRGRRPQEQIRCDAPGHGVRATRADSPPACRSSSCSEDWSEPGGSGYASLDIHF